MSEKMRYRGMTFTVDPWHGGYVAGAEGARGATKMEAVQNAYRLRSARAKEDDARYRQQRIAYDAKQATKTECRVCNVRVSNLRTHERSKSHANRLAWERYQRDNRTRV